MNTMYNMLPFVLVSVLLHIHAAFGNVEKVIFHGPSSLEIPIEHPTLSDLQLEALSPQQPSLRTLLEAEFPNNSSKHGPVSWILLQRLHEGQRYEVRICWAATQPTSFRLETHEISTVFQTPELISSLAEYSAARQQDVTDFEDETPGSAKGSWKSKHVSEDTSSTLFLQVFAAADYYTTNRTLMENVPPVFVDIILDPFIFNIFPKSLIPTAAYLILLAVGSWYISQYIATWLLKVAKDATSQNKKKS